MIGLLLVASLGLADEPGEPETYTRLFGAAPAVALHETEVSDPSPWKMVAALAMGVAGLWGAWRLRSSASRDAPGKPLHVLCRHPLGDRTALVLLEVVDADGERRRLLIGTGAGAPTLVADLGQVPDIVAAQPIARAQPGATLVDEVLAERHGEPFSAHAARHGVLA